MKTTIKQETEKVILAVKHNHNPYVICSCCGRGGMQYGYYGLSEWVCIWRDCPFKTNKIPSIQEIKDLIHLKTQLKQIKDWKI